MYIVWTDTGDEFTRIKLTLGAGSKRASSMHDVTDFLDRYPDCQMVIIGATIKENSAFEISSRLRISAPYVNVILLRNRIDVATLSSALTAGFRDVVDAQDAAALVSAVKRCEEISRQMAKSEVATSMESTEGKVITVYSAKGGCGKTTVATNLAASLARMSSARVCLVDLDLQFGDVAVALRIEPTKTISHALEMKENIDSQSLSHVLLRYDDSFDTLLAPTSPSDIEFISPEFIQNILMILQGMYDFVIIDASPTFNDLLIRALEASDCILLLTTLDMPAIKNLKVALSTIDAVGYPNSQIRIIVNRADAKIGLTIDDVEAFVGVKIFDSIPSSTDVSASTNQGIPIVIAHPKHPVSRAIEGIAQSVLALAKSNLSEAVA